MTARADFAEIEKASRLARLLSPAGAILVLIALWLSSQQLVRVQSRVRDLSAEAANLTTQMKPLRDSLDSARTQLSRSRDALVASRSAIIAFHQRDYGAAVVLYDQAIKADSGNAYLLNLRAYALFKQGRIDDALTGQRLSIRADSLNGYGFFDLGRFQCAAGNFAGAKASLAKAVQLEDRFRQLIRDDGEIQRLCRPIIP